ncbi:MAG: hypothetical protein A3A44_01190 [Candidatus Sungbacteria bacterium RIFCSPLOWO2_01_FULL_60_25]|uniref:VTT domain-containing protein n=1 Tax=Candidatus Sungbacteria bacterium RIFCSPLOWO2_01_FULL_60_25 TaxID=1802281 RepID=A0A1G2LF90_9BACT|nr:MAG: hypothetical protein A3A44_01190 [Candidatus Sungbacteria bacterium RIFCSPLOWO2_01_FULL_60_25]
MLPGDLTALILAAGYLGLFAVVFAESGLLIGFFLPGDSLLFTAGFLASQGYFDIGILVFGCFAAAVLGDSVGYAFGRRVGPAIFRREESLLFNPRNLVHARTFYEQHGGKAIILARFLPVIRTFAPILAGVGQMRYRSFLAYNVVGALLWAAGMPLAGFALGNIIPNADRYLIPVVALIVVLSAAPSFIHILRDPGRRRAIRAIARDFLARHRTFRRTIGIFFIAFGIFALVTPLVPFSWLIFVGLQFLGLHTLFGVERVIRWRPWGRDRPEP